jgi:hypothetical protein
MSKLRATLVSSFFLVLLSGSSMPTWAQRTTASLSGTVTDPSDAAIPDAKVTVTDMQTGIATPGSTNSRGFYVLPSLVYRFINTYPLHSEVSASKFFQR